MDVDIVSLVMPDGANIISGSSHFIKTVEDLYEAIVNTVPGAKFGIAFCEASGECLIRWDGNDEELKQAAIENAKRVAAGHSFFILLRDAYPINVLGRIKDVPEVCTIHCATANPIQMIVIKSEQGRGIAGVIDGYCPKEVETEIHQAERHGFLRRIGYKK